LIPTDGLSVGVPAGFWRRPGALFRAVLLLCGAKSMAAGRGLST